MRFMFKLVLKITQRNHEDVAYLFLVLKFIKRLCFNCLLYLTCNGRVIVNVSLEECGGK
jgi:hypothetical protein